MKSLLRLVAAWLGVALLAACGGSDVFTSRSTSASMPAFASPSGQKW